LRERDAYIWPSTNGGFSVTRSIPLEHHNADLATDFGLSFATKLFGPEAIASLPVRAAGKNKGKPKGCLIWRTATTAGYCRECQSPVKAGGYVDAWIANGPFGSRSDAVQGTWLGRPQSLASSFSSGYFFEEGRAREMARQQEEASRWQEEASR
jgi:hypothetical protein